MDLPDPITAIGQQIEGGGAITPDEEFFEAYEVFSAELANIFVKPWLVVDHASRIAADNSYFRFDIGSRSIVVSRESKDCIHALRNACLHAGYRICEEEDGKGDHLFCNYHGWDYALDGRLTEPVLRPEVEDRSRFRLPRYAMEIQQGLVFVDLSKAGPNPPESVGLDLSGVPDVTGQVVTGRRRYPTTWNWKHLRQTLWGAKENVFATGECDAVVEFGALSFLATQNGETVLTRIVPRFPGHTDIELVCMGAPGSKAAEDRIGESVRDTSQAILEAPLSVLQRPFYEWYWSTLSASAAA
ncbi:MAG TPA: Rieske (2Fe-2S) protein [Stellaceae bacterium]|jgi:nitrite reductase/ring-hydroxylating ferredoxin subunit|nr:Rieske (2Fe-2S) protein [Stellaceae bacterium]